MSQIQYHNISIGNSTNNTLTNPVLAPVQTTLISPVKTHFFFLIVRFKHKTYP